MQLIEDLFFLDETNYEWTTFFYLVRKKNQIESGERYFQIIYICGIYIKSRWKMGIFSSTKCEHSYIFFWIFVKLKQTRGDWYSIYNQISYNQKL